MLNGLYMAAAILAFGLFHLVASFPFAGSPESVASGIAATVTAMVIGVLSFFLWKWIGDQRETPFNAWPSVGSAVFSVLLGALLKQAALGTQVWDWLAAPVVAGGAAGAFHWLKASVDLVYCSVCKRPQRRHQTVTCPRCHEPVCLLRSCWDAPASRCTVCLTRGVIRFPLDERWWRERLGPRVSQGECLSCLKSARETDLRECRRCHFPMCRRCWDHKDGGCDRCGWEIPDRSAGLKAG